MRKLMRLDEAIEKKIVKNLDIMDPNALFPKRINKVILEPRITGMDEPQKIYRQDFEWVFFKTRVKRDINLSMLAIGKEGNKNASVSLRGKTGYVGDSSCWWEINNLYSNRCNGITAYALTDGELTFLLERNKKFKGFKFATWLSATFREIIPIGNKSGYKCGIKFVRERSILKKALWYSTGHIESCAFDYCPRVRIWGPEEILVVLNSKKKNGKWKLIPRKGLLKWKYRLF